MKQRPREVLRFAAPLRNLAQRFMFLLLLLASVAIMLAGKADPQIFDRTRQKVTDFAAPILDALSRPVATIDHFVAEGQMLLRSHQENKNLRIVNQRLLQWQTAARQLEAENKQLRSLLNFRRDDAERYITARVIGDSGGAFVRSLLVNRGRTEGIRKGQAAVLGEGLIGRVATVGERSSRILLITDLNSRIPVLIEQTRARAVLAGDNSAQPKLIFLSANTDLQVGQRIVTSGHGGAFPPGIPVGVITSLGEQGMRVTPYAKDDRLEYLRLMDFGLNGILPAKKALVDTPKTSQVTP